MLDLQSGRALVPGSPPPKENAKMKVKTVLRFWYQGELIEKDKEIEVDDALGRELVTSGKAVMVEEAVFIAGAVAEETPSAPSATPRRSRPSA